MSAPTIASFKDRHRGEPVCLLANGMSVLEHPLKKVPARFLTTNRAWELRWPDYHVVIESEHERQRPDIYNRLADEGKLFVQGWHFGADATAWGRAVRIPTTTKPQVSFSRALATDGAVCNLDGVGSVVYVALQLAAWMGFDPIYCLGLDLGGDHFHKRWRPSEHLTRQNELFARVPSDVHVFNVGSPDSLCDAFEKITFDSMLERIEKEEACKVSPV